MNYYIIDVERKFSKKNQEYYHEVTLIDDESGKPKRTYLNVRNHNWKAWKGIIEKWDKHTAVAITGNFKPVPRHDDLISADSKPTFVDVCELDALIALVEKIYG
jgi:hypothetical protein